MTEPRSRPRKVTPKRGTAARTPTVRPARAVGDRAPAIRWADDTPVNSDDARGRIVAAAVECVRRYGVDKTGIDDVAKAAAITRPTVYKYFSSRNALFMAVFLSVLDERLDRGLETFLVDAKSVDDFRQGLAEATAWVLEVLRTDEVIQEILTSTRIPAEQLLSESAGLLVRSLELSLVRVGGWLVENEGLMLLRPISLDALCGWIIRALYAHLVWPGESPEAEVASFRDFLGPVIFRDG